MTERLFDLFRETMRGERAALVDKAKPAREDVPPPWVSRLLEEAAPLLQGLREEGGKGADLLSHPLVGRLLERFLTPEAKGAPRAASASADDDDDGS